MSPDPSAFDVARRRRPLPRIALALLATALGALALEGGASVLLSWRAAADPRETLEQRHCRFDPELGWSHRPDVEARDLYGPGLHLRTNSQGLRGTRTYAPEPPAGVRRVVCVGDSFTLGYGVGDESSWPARLESRGFEALNFGQGAYGLDQCYLWYRRDGTAFEADVLLVAVIGEDLHRMLPETALTDRGKPFLSLAGGELVVRPPTIDDWREPGSVALQRVWARTALGQLTSRWRPRSRRPDWLDADVAQRPFAPLVRRVLAEFDALAAQRGLRFALVYLPVAAELRGGKASYAPWLAEVTGELGVTFCDLSSAFAALGPRRGAELFLPDNHYSAAGHEFVAATLAQWPGLLPTE